VGWLPGALFGGAFVLFVPSIAERLIQDLSVVSVFGSTYELIPQSAAERISRGLSGAVYGVILILLIYLMPTGAAGFVRSVLSRLDHARS
ncbi:MAG: hypothetical protein JOZ16_03750, partial [Methylobacteriaceae bacterium]|nr:hypothetical protein [Methylobacteriaceae bacterium]